MNVTNPLFFVRRWSSVTLGQTICTHHASDTGAAHLRRRDGAALSKKAHQCVLIDLSRQPRRGAPLPTADARSVTCTVVLVSSTLPR